MKFLLFIVLSGSVLMSVGQKTGYDLLPLLVAESGDTITTTEEWETIRRPEILEMFQRKMYGMNPSPDFMWDMEMDIVEEDRTALNGTAIRKQIDLVLSRDGRSHTIPLLLYLPANADGPVPVFLGLNFYGNQTIHPDRNIPLSTSWVPTKIEFGIMEHEATHESRGARYDRWPVEWLLEQGYGIAAMYSGDIDPDYHDGFENGIHSIFPDQDRDSSSWGTIAAWAWGLSRAMDYLETDEDVDGDKVIVFGHSRHGKASLWAGATDQRFSGVISNESGCGGAALSKRKQGETLADINRNFPHWFCDKFKTYSDNEGSLGFDQHMLIALMAPRPVYVASAQKDQWADPEGEYLSIYHAGPVYELYGIEALPSPIQPEPLLPLTSYRTAYHMRTGRHDHTRYDWARFMEWVGEW